MFKCKVFKILKKLSDKELARFILFVKSPYYNNRKAVIAIAELMRVNSFDFNGEWLMRESLFAVIFPNEPYRYKRISQQMSYLNELALEFMSQIESEREVAVRRVLAGIQCVMHGLNSVARDMLKDAKRIAEQSPYRDGEYFYAQILIAILESILEQGNVHNTDKDAAVQKALDIWYLHFKFHYSSTMRTQKALVNGVPDIPLLSDLLAGLKDHEYLKIPLVGLYLHSLLMNANSSDSDEHYQLFSELFFSHVSELPLSDRIALHTKANNYCLTKYYSGNENFLLNAFLYDKFAEEEGFLIDKELILSERKFKSQITLALECGEIEWAEYFIEKYSSKLSDDTREMTVELVLAELECCRGNFDIALKHLANFKKNDDFDYLKFLTLHMKINFECGEWTAADTYCSYARKFITRSRTFSIEAENRLRPLYNFTSQLAKEVSKPEPDIFTFLEKIEHEVQAIPVNSKPWLLSQIEKMKSTTEFIIPLKIRLPKAIKLRY